MTDVRCPHCQRKVAEELNGKLVLHCARCGRWSVIVDNRDKVVI
jgi:endogenous inhibitor of DNA gyrase (YacG/DUF329 family)